MTFPKALQGVKKIFTSQILHLIGGFCTVIAAIFGIIAVGAASAESTGGMVAGGIGTIVFLIAAGVLPIIGYILQLVGLKQASHDEGRFNQAFIIAIFALILNVLVSVFSSLNVGNGVVDNIVKIFVEVANIVIVILVINGIQNLATRLGNDDILDLGGKIIILLAVIYGLALVANLVIAIFGANEGAEITAGVLAIAAGILDIVAYIIFLVYLGKSKKMLQEG